MNRIALPGVASDERVRRSADLARRHRSCAWPCFNVGVIDLVSATDVSSLRRIDEHHAGQLAKYEAWLAGLEERRERLRGSRGRYIRALTGCLLLSNLGFFWGFWIGVGSLFSGVMIFGYGVLTVRGLEWECTSEIENMRRGTELLRSVQSGQRPRDT